MANFSRHGTDKQRQYLLYIAKKSDVPFAVTMWALEQAWRLKMPEPEARLKQALAQPKYCSELLDKCARFPARDPEWSLWLACIQLAFKSAKSAREVVCLYQEMHRGLRELVPVHAKRHRTALATGMRKVSTSLRAKVLGNEAMTAKLMQVAGPAWTLIVLHQNIDAPENLSGVPDADLAEILQLTQEGGPLREAVFNEMLRRAEAGGRLFDMLFEAPAGSGCRSRIKKRLVETSYLADWLDMLGRGGADPQQWEAIMEIVMAQIDREANHTPAELLSLRDMAKTSAPKGAHLRTMLKKIDNRICKLAKSCA
jgi:hypothetical protein